MKNTLVKMETPGSGRVPLDRFYAGGVDDTNWQFLESVPYLEQLGALDNADPQHMSVIISNYVNSPTNCVASSRFYSVCCVDECDSLLSTLEGRIAAPDASPSLIAQLIAGLPSDTVSAPRTLPASLVQRLNEIASHHGGKVPLHGRLFAQWMHHAYPRECVYPHLSGTTNPVTAEAYMDQTGNEIFITKKEVQDVISKVSSQEQPEADTELPWSGTEELFMYRPEVPQPAGTWSLGGVFVFACVLSSAALVVQRSFAIPGDMKGGSASKDLFV